MISAKRPPKGTERSRLSGAREQAERSGQCPFHPFSTFLRLKVRQGLGPSGIGAECFWGPRPPRDHKAVLSLIHGWCLDVSVYQERVVGLLAAP